MPDKWNVFDLAEAFQLSHAVFTLHELELFNALKKPATADELAAKYAIDGGFLRGTMEYVASRTDLLRKSGKRFVATGQYSRRARFLLDLYVGAYGENAAQLAKLLRDSSLASGLVDRARHARAFESAGPSTLGLLPQLIERLGFDHVLDLGCGNGALLLELARQDPNFVGWGIEQNGAMFKAAKARIRAARLGKRVHVLEGDCTNLSAVLPAKVSDVVGLVTASNVANEMFADGDSRVITWLKSMRKTLGGRPLLIADYYGRLGHKEQPSPETLLHDYAQLISGQGVPPPSATRWRSIYRSAGCRLVHMIEDKATTRFVHILRL